MANNQNLANHPAVQHLSRVFTAIPFNDMLGLKLDHIDSEHVVMSFKMKKELIGNFLHNILHGGVISSALDMAGGIVVMAGAVSRNPHADMPALIEILGKCSTIDLQISYLRPGRGEKFVAKAWLIKSGKNISFARMELYNEENILIATGSATYMLP
jgi:uncharacterized protein (TIGR00369 family)